MVSFLRFATASLLVASIVLLALGFTDDRDAKDLIDTTMTHRIENFGWAAKKAEQMKETAVWKKIGAGAVFVSALIILGISEIVRRMGQSQKDSKKCPECAELVKDEAIKCRFCGHIFEISLSTAAAEQTDGDQSSPRRKDPADWRQELENRKRPK